MNKPISRCRLYDGKQRVSGYLYLFEDETGLDSTKGFIQHLGSKWIMRVAFSSILTVTPTGVKSTLRAADKMIRTQMKWMREQKDRLDLVA